jgi:hypothetical protein
VFLVFTFFLYLLGLVFVLGAELNAFLQEPARSAALALRGGGVLGAPTKSPAAQMRDAGNTMRGADRQPDARPEHAGGGVAGHVLGFVGLLLAVVLLRNQKETTTT